MPKAENAQVDLVTVRDWLRYAVSRFNAAGLAYGHGTATELDEAAFLILHTLHLPIDNLEPWLDARLLPTEREAMHKIVEKRVSTRQPASYLTKEAWIQGHSFYVDERVIVPRSYIGELLCRQMGAPPHEWHLGLERIPVRRVLDLCTGSGCLGILAALTFLEAQVDATDIAAGALAVAGRNVKDYGLTDRISLVCSDLFSELTGRRYDLILANPPYVSDEAVAHFPPEYAAEPKLAHAGGHDGLEIVRRILAEAGNHLAPEGSLVVEVGTGRPILERDYPQLPFLWLDTAEADSEVFALAASALAKSGPRVGQRRRRRRSSERA